MKFIAVEEAFVTPDIISAWSRKIASGDAEAGFKLLAQSVLFGDTDASRLMCERLLDIGKGRIAQMDADGLDVQVLSLTSPGIQVLDTDEAVELAADANNQLADAVRRFPERLYGLTAVAPQDPERAALEIERGVSLGMKGIIINSHTHGTYLDEARFTPLLESAAAHNQPIYLHPRDPAPSMITPMLDYGLALAIWGFAAETGLHAMRLIMSGVFDRHPALKVVLGHMGEAIPFWLQRIDNRYELLSKLGAMKRLERLPSEYFKENFAITTSGVTSSPALELAVKVLGTENIMFAADYPYESAPEAVEFLKGVQDDDLREKIGFRNATRFFNL